MRERESSAARLTASTFGALAGLGGLRHGIGEVQQGNVRPDGLFIESWTEGPLAEHFDGEPGMTIVPNMLVTGILTIVVSSVVVAWAVLLVQRRRGGGVLSLLSLVMMLVGGGIGPPVVGILAGWPGRAIGPGLERWRGRLTDRTRSRLAARWPLAYLVATLNGLFLFVVSLVMIFAFDFRNADVLLWSFFLSVVLLVATTLCAIAHDLGPGPLPD